MNKRDNWRDRNDKGGESSSSRWDSPRKYGSSSKYDFGGDKRKIYHKPEFADKKYGYNRSNDFLNDMFLKNLLNKDCEDILSIVSTNIEQYSRVMETKFNDNILILIVQVIAKVCDSTFVANKCKVLNKTLGDNFMMVLNGYISTFVLESKTDGEFWESFENFLINISKIFSNALEFMPTAYWQKVQNSVKLMEINMALIENEGRIIFSDTFKTKFFTLKEVILKLELKYMKKKKNDKTVIDDNEVEPENDYRFINIYPSLKELVVPERNFIRKNIIIGSYKSVAHYLDVQFRLLREDFLNPIREDLCDYINKVNRRFFNIKIHENVKFIGADYDKDNDCLLMLMNIGEKLKDMLRRRDTKRFLHGTLVLFTNDNFKSIICGSVVKSDLLLTEGKLTIEFKQFTPKINIYYKMVECLIYFEPYYRVMNVLQRLPQIDLPMERYILNVETSIYPPRFMRSGYTPRITGLNKSQSNALAKAFNQEFVIIQGPPGTGKTYLGLTIAKELLRIIYRGPILIVCYTNHALDQFLEGLLDTTDAIIRLGSQTKSTILKKHSLHEKKLFLNRQKSKIEKSLFNESYSWLKSSEALITDSQSWIAELDVPSGIIQLKIIRTYVKYIKYTGLFDLEDDEFFSWLLEDDNSTNISSASPRADSIRYRDEKTCDLYLNHLKNNWHYLILLTVDDLNFAKINIERLIAKSENYKRECEIMFSNGKLSEKEMLEINENCMIEIEALQEDLKLLLDKTRILAVRLNQKYEEPPQEIDYVNPFNIPITVRWQLYFSWLTILKQSFLRELHNQIEDYKEAFKGFSVILENENVRTLKQMKVVGMTTTCAARMYSTLQKLKCPIVIVEEAAEVLESHIISALTPHCQHLILLGDHQQLKPSTCDYTLEKQYKLGVSLFERMILNNIQCHTLNVQHRMRPEISRLICPAIYPELINHKSVYEFPAVVGVEQSVYFIDHSEPEEAFGDSSKLNMHEAKFLIKFTEYLIYAGYDPKEITILAAYTGQVVTLQKEISRVRNLNTSCVHITAVDNFQGEENRIILLSLVRNNPDNTMGFLSIENRVCVALSRAKEGLFIMGNMRQLCASSKVWKIINETLMAENSIGKKLPLKCQNHGTQTLVEFAEDFENVPLGGCYKDCEKLLPCGHKCTLRCHIEDFDHKKFLCRAICDKKICKHTEHKRCLKRCYEDCEICDELFAQRLECGHVQEIRCHQRTYLDTVECNEKVAISLSCGHIIENLCSISIEELKCNVKTLIELPCGHTAEKSCNVSNDEIKCETNVPVELSCGHTTENLCGVIMENFKCNKQVSVELSCGHTTEKLCSDSVDGIKCNQQISTELPCRHKVEKMCSVSIKDFKCTLPCNAKLPRCDHRCASLCHKDLDPTHQLYSCEVICERENMECSKPRNKHKSTLPCYRNYILCPEKVYKIRKECKHKYIDVTCHINIDGIACTKPCNKFLACNHKCVNKCYEPCGPCKKQVCRKDGCGHFISTLCGTDFSKVLCMQPCMKTLECGHKCRKRCSEQCTSKCWSYCAKLLDCGHRCINVCQEVCACQEVIIPECGHQIKIKCCDIPKKENCVKHCRSLLNCGHACMEKCNEPCTTDCKQLCDNRNAKEKCDESGAYFFPIFTLKN